MVKKLEEAGLNPFMLQQILDAYPGDVTIVDSDYTILYTNLRHHSDILGENSIIGEKCFRHCHYLQEGSAECFAKTVFATKAPMKGLQVQLKDDRWLEINSIPLKNAQGDVMMVAEFVKDITEMKQEQETTPAGTDQADEGAEQISAEQMPVVTEPELRERRTLGTLTLEHNREGEWSWNTRKNTMTYSQDFLRMLGYEPGTQDETFAAFSRMVHPSDFGQVFKGLQDYMNHKADAFSMEYRMLCSNRKYKWVQSNAHANWDRDGNAIEIHGVHKDISEQKLREEQERYQNLRDPLTELYNRSYFEDTVYRLDTDRMHPLSIFLVEIDSLKETYELFGTDVAEKMVIRTANLMRSIFRHEDVVARWDERTYAVILPNTSADMTQDIHQRIMKATEDHREVLMEPVLAVGYATKITAEADVKLTFIGARQRLKKSREEIAAAVASEKSKQ